MCRMQWIRINIAAARGATHHAKDGRSVQVPDDELANRRIAALERHGGSLEHSLTAAQPCPDGLTRCVSSERMHTLRSNNMPDLPYNDGDCRSLRILLATSEELDSAEQKPNAAWDQVRHLVPAMPYCS